MTRDDFKNLYTANFGTPREWETSGSAAVLGVWYAWTDGISGDILKDVIENLEVRPGTRPTLKALKDAYGHRYSKGVGWAPPAGTRCLDCEGAKAILTIWVRDDLGRLQLVNPDKQIINRTAHIRADFCYCTAKPAPQHIWDCRFPPGNAVDRYLARARGEKYMEPVELDADLADYLERILAMKATRDEAKTVNRNAQRFGPTVAAFAEQEEKLF